MPIFDIRSVFLLLGRGFQSSLLCVFCTSQGESILRLLLLMCHSWLLFSNTLYFVCQILLDLIPPSLITFLVFVVVLLVISFLVSILMYSLSLSMVVHFSMLGWTPFLSLCSSSWGGWLSLCSSSWCGWLSLCFSSYGGWRSLCSSS